MKAAFYILNAVSIGVLLIVAAWIYMPTLDVAATENAHLRDEIVADVEATTDISELKRKYYMLLDARAHVDAYENMSREVLSSAILFVVALQFANIYLFYRAKRNDNQTLT